MTHLTHHYDTLGSFISAAQREPLPCTLAESRKHSTSGDWHGTATFEQAIDLALRGWPEGRKNLMLAMAQAQSSPAFSPAFTMDVAGAYPIAAFAAAGDPCSMVNPAPLENRVRPIVRLVIPRNGSASYDPHEFMNYGAAVLSYVEGLEDAGFRCEITVAFSAHYSSGPIDHLMTVLVKRAEEPLELDRMAFVLTHAAFFRRIGFAVKESTAGVAEYLGAGYGRPRVMEPERDAERGQILLPAINAAKPGSKELSSPQNAMELLGPMIETQLREAGLAPPAFAFAGKEGE